MKTISFSKLFSYLCLFLLRLRKNKVENYADDGGKTYAGNGEGTGCENGATQAHRQHHRDDDDIAGFIHVYLVLHQILHAHTCDGSEKQQHDAT